MWRERPILGSYWLRPGRLLAGEYPGAVNRGDAREKLRRLREAGVTFFLDLTEEGELDPYLELVERSDIPLEHRRMAVRDFSAPGNVEIVAILDTLDEALGGPPRRLPALLGRRRAHRDGRRLSPSPARRFARRRASTNQGLAGRDSARRAGVARDARAGRARALLETGEIA